MPFIPPGGVPPTPNATTTVKGKIKLANALGGTADLPTVIDHAQITGTSDLHTEYVKEADANWVDLTDAGATTLHSHAGGGGSHAILDGSTHTDSVADVVSRGSLIYGNSTPAWDELVVGAANSVPWTDGTDVSWSAAPRLANIADTGGTNRITTATSSPQLTITGDSKFNGKLILNATDGTAQLLQVDISPTISAMAATWTGIQINPLITFSGSNLSLLVHIHYRL